MIVRLAGASAGFLEHFRHSRLLELVDTHSARCADLEVLRRQLVEVLFELVSRDCPSERRFLLKLKRDAFNGRPVHRRRHHELWPMAAGETGDHLQALAAAEESLDALEGELESCFAEAVAAERSALLAFAEDADFQRGLALASPLVARARARYAGRGGRRAAAMEKSLLRYATRTAVKISPYSTLTPITLARAEGDLSSLRFHAGPRRTDSAVRIKRHLLDPVCRRLFRHPDLLAELPLGLNPTLEVLSEGRCRFLRGRAAERQEKRSGLGAAASLVTVGLEGAWFDLLQARLAGGQALPFGELLDALDGDPAVTGSLAEHASLLRELQDLGLLEVRPPWPGYVPRLEEQLLVFLSALPAGLQEDLRPVIASLQGLLAEQESFCRSARPEEAVGRFKAGLGELHAAVGHYTSTTGQELPEPEVRSVYEDVVVSSRHRETVLDLPLDSLRRAQSAVDPLWRLGSLFSPRHEVVLGLSAWLEKRYGAHQGVALMPLFAETQKLWRLAVPRLRGTSGQPFDPFELPAVAELERLRARVRRRLEAAMVPGDPPGACLGWSTADLEAILGEIPQSFHSPVAPALCLQPVDAAGSAWVANEIFAGVGKMSSRFSSVLLEAQKQRYLEAAMARSRVGAAGESFELLDLMFTKGNTVNVHWPQTRKVFVGPGETVDLPADRAVRPADLSVRRLEDGRLRLVCGTGEQLLPVFLSPMNESYLPQLWQFLLLFGVGGSALQLPEALSSAAEGVEIVPRLVVGNLVVRRRQWRIAASSTPDLGGDELADFVRIRSWRRQLDLPEQVYVREKVAGDHVIGNRFKPQFVDFRSPSLVACLREAMSLGETLVLTEALPERQDYPLDPGLHGPRTFEVVIDGSLG